MRQLTYWRTISYETNHNREKSIAQQAGDIADSLENQLWDAKQAQS